MGLELEDLEGVIFQIEHGGIHIQTFHDIIHSICLRDISEKPEPHERISFDEFK